MRVLLLGPPGAGKGTQSKLIHKKLGIPVLVMGDMLRASVKKGDDVGKEAEPYMKRGDLVPDVIIIRVILERLQEDDCKQKGFILDGFPRTVQQAEALDDDLKKNNINLDVVLYYSIPDDIVVHRISGRRTVEQRNDDKPEVVENRLREYHEKTAPLLEYYKKQGLLREINANRDVNIVFEDSVKHL